MLSLYIVGYGKEYIHEYIVCLQNRLKTFIKQQNISLYNLRTLCKAESSPNLLQRNTRFILPIGDNKHCEYWGVLSANDCEALYSRMFSPLEIIKPSCSRYHPYTSSNLKSLIERLAKPNPNDSSKEFSYDFRIVYHSDLINASDIICITQIDINDESLDAFDFFYGVVTELDRFCSEAFLSAYIDNSYIQNFDVKFDKETLLQKIINTGKAFYKSNKLIYDNLIVEKTAFRQYNVSQMKNGTWFVLRDICNDGSVGIAQTNDLLIPHYMVVDWSNLSAQRHLNVNDFDLISVYHDRYSPSDPTLILSRGYLPEQVDNISREYGDMCFQERYTKESWFPCY